MRYNDYYEMSERMGWRITDLDWNVLRREADAGKVSRFDEEALLGTTVIEYGVPHYSEVWTLVDGVRHEWDLWQFTTLWTGEEHRHSFALRKACDTLGITPRVEADLEAVERFRFAETQKQTCATDCYRTIPGMLAYTVIQELATNKFYGLAAKRTESPFLKELFGLIAADELRHHVYYRDALKDLHGKAKDREAYVESVYDAVRAFKMPHLIYGLQTEFFEQGDWTIGRLGKLAFKAQLARCFSFDAGLLARLASSNAEAELDAKRQVFTRTGVSATP